jgi:hypothetical protein
MFYNWVLTFMLMTLSRGIENRALGCELRVWKIRNVTFAPLQKDIRTRCHLQ